MTSEKDPKIFRLNIDIFFLLIWHENILNVLANVTSSISLHVEVTITFTVSKYDTISLKAERKQLSYFVIKV